MKEQKKSMVSGITLIALVVTIIILLILAGVSIMMLTGDNGILNRAGETKEKNKRAEIIEQAKMDIMAKQVEHNGGITIIELKDILLKYGSLSEDEETLQNKILTTTVGSYEIVVKEIYNGTFIPSNETNTYTVIFDENEGNIDGANTITVTEGQKYGALPIVTRTGYTFEGWYTETEGGVEITENSIVEITENQTLYAHWTINTYSVRFIKNDNDAIGVMEDQTFTYGTSQNLTKNLFTKTGYVFKGWSTDSSTITQIYSDEESVNNLGSSNGEIIYLYAIWVEKQELIFTKEFLNSGSKNTSNTSTVSVTTNNLINSINYPGLNITGRDNTVTNWSDWNVQSSVRWYKTINFDNYDTLEFYAKKGANHGVIHVYIDDTSLLSVHYNNAPTSWTKYSLNVSSYNGDHVLSFIGGYRDNTGNASSNTKYCNIKLTNY